MIRTHETGFQFSVRDEDSRGIVEMDIMRVNPHLEPYSMIIMLSKIGNVSSIIQCGLDRKECIALRDLLLKNFPAGAN